MRLITTKTTIGELKPKDLYVLDEQERRDLSPSSTRTVGWLLWMRHDEPVPDGREREIVYKVEAFDE